MAWTGKTRGNLLGYQIFAYLIKYLGVRAAYALLRFVTFYFFIFARNPVKVMMDFYQRRMNFGFWKSVKYTYLNFNRIGESIIDKVAISVGRKDFFEFDLEMETQLVSIIKKHEYAVLISGHCGNWDIAGQFLDRINPKVNLVMYEGEVEKVKGFMDAFMGERSFNIIGISNDGGHIYKISKAISGKELICLHGDRWMSGQPVFKHNFLGEEAIFPAGPFQLVARLKTPYVFVYCMKQSSRKYKFFCSEPPVMGLKAEEIFEKYVQGFEEKVKLYPDQWFNYYDFWKKN